MVAENIQICGVQVRGNRVCKSKKMKVDIVTKAKLSARSLSSPHGKDKLLIPPVKGENYENLFKNQLP